MRMILLTAALAFAAGQSCGDARPCTCHPDDNPPQPCEHRYAFRDCADAAEERYLREMLAILQESYAKAAKPYMDRLVALHSRSLPQMLVTVEQAQALGLLPANARLSGAGTASA